jgi:hypothetical protein
MSTCGKITKAQTFNCEAPMSGGAKDRIAVINFDDVDVLTRDVTNPQILRSIVLKATKKAYKWEGPVNSVIASAKLARGKFKNKYEQIVGLPLMANTSDLKNELEKAAYGKFIVIVENNHTVGDSVFEVYFLEKGGIILKNERDIVNTDLEGGYDINFGQEEAFREGHLPATFAVLDAEVVPAYSYSLTLAALEALFV